MLNFIRKWAATKAQDGALNDLERLFRAAMRDPRRRDAFYGALLEAELLVGGVMKGAGEAELQFYDLAGEKILPVFSHVDRLKQALGPDAALLRFPGRDLFRQVAPGLPVALNPYSDFGREFSAAELSEILQR